MMAAVNSSRSSIPSPSWSIRVKNETHVNPGPTICFFSSGCVLNHFFTSSLPNDGFSDPSAPFTSPRPFAFSAPLKHARAKPMERALAYPDVDNHRCCSTSYTSKTSVWSAVNPSSKNRRLPHMTHDPVSFISCPRPQMPRISDWILVAMHASNKTRALARRAAATSIRSTTATHRGSSSPIGRPPMSSASCHSSIAEGIGSRTCRHAAALAEDRFDTVSACR